MLWNRQHLVYYNGYLGILLHSECAEESLVAKHVAGLTLVPLVEFHRLRGLSSLVTPKVVAGRRDDHSVLAAG